MTSDKFNGEELDVLEGWPPEDIADMQDRAGLACFMMVALSEQWVHRRVETISILTGENTLRHTSVDFTVPRAMRSALEFPSVDQYVVPLAFLDKTPLRKFSLSCDNRPVPQLTRTQNSALSKSVLRWAARYALDSSEIEDELENELASLLDDVVDSPPPVAFEAIDKLLGKAEEEGSQAAAIVETVESAVLVNTLADGYLMCGVLDTPYVRKVVKYEYEKALEPDDEAGSAASPRGIKSVLARIRNWIETLSGSVPLFRLPVPSAWFGESFHCEVVVPEELRINLAVLTDFASDSFDPIATDWNVDRASLYSAEIGALADPAVVLDIAAERSGFPTVAMTIGWFTSAILIAGTAVELQPKISGPAVSVLLATSSAYAGWMVRPGEHRLVQAIFRVPRFAMAAAAVAGIAGATSLAFGAEDCTRRSIWFAASVFAVVSALQLTAFWWRSAAGRRF